MQETSYIESFFFKKKHWIHGNLAHDRSPEGKIRWYIYTIEDIPCHKQIVGSTINPTKRWAVHKSSCNSKSSKSTGISKHFMEGCPHDPGKQKDTLKMTLIDYWDTTAQKLLEAGHEKGAQCRCRECNSLKNVEDKWILQLGTFYGQSGLNTRDEIKSKSRGNNKSN